MRTADCILVLSFSKDGRALHPWFDKLTMVLEQAGSGPRRYLASSTDIIGLLERETSASGTSIVYVNPLLS